MSLDQEIVDSGRTKRRLAAWKLTLVLIIALLLVLGGSFVVWQQHAARAVEEQIASLQAAGEPVTIADLDHYYRLPAGTDDCTALYLSAFQALDDPAYTADCGNLPIVGDNDDDDPPVPPLAWPELPQAEALLAKYQPSLVQLHEAADRGGAARYPIDFAGDIESFFTHLNQLRKGARLLQLAGLVCAYRGDAHGAAQAIHAQWGAGNSLAQEPLLVSQLPLMFTVGSAVAQVKQFFPVVDFSDDDLRQLQADFRGFDAQRSISRACRGERGWGLHSIEQSLGEDFKPHYSVPRRWLLHTERNYWLDYMTRVIAVVDSPFSDSRSKLERLEHESAQALDGSFLDRIGKSAVAEKKFIPLSATKAVYRAAAKARTGDAAIAAELFRRQQGRWPDSLAQLVPEFLPAVPDDPFDGRPLRMARRGEDLVIYSIGADFQDDGGLLDHDFSPQSDIVFGLRRASRTEQEH